MEEVKDKLITLQKEYIEFLGEQYNELVTIASVRGFKVSDELVREGGLRRAHIEMYEKLNDKHNSNKARVIEILLEMGDTGDSRTLLDRTHLLWVVETVNSGDVEIDENLRVELVSLIISLTE